jgi:hypothetical protein
VKWDVTSGKKLVQAGNNIQLIYHLEAGTNNGVYFQCSIQRVYIYTAKLSSFGQLV